MTHLTITPRTATADEIRIPPGAVVYHLSRDQLRHMQRGGQAREIIELELVTLAHDHLRDSIWVAGPDRVSNGDAALAVVTESGEILYPPAEAETAAPAPPPIAPDLLDRVRRTVTQAWEAGVIDAADLGDVAGAVTPADLGERVTAPEWIGILNAVEANAPKRRRAEIEHEIGELRRALGGEP